MDIKSIDTKEVLRYLGYKKNMELTEATKQLVREAEVLTLQRAEPKIVTGSFPLVRDKNHVRVAGTSLSFESEQLSNTLRGCEEVVLMAATLGLGIERLIRSLEQTDLSMSVVVDACATALIEQLCDREEDKLKECYRNDGLFVTPRFSPGYGDLPLTIQKDFVGSLMADKTIGLRVSEENLLIPRKSVTAFLGVTKEERKQARKSCETCTQQACPYKKEGTHCGH